MKFIIILDEDEMYNGGPEELFMQLADFINNEWWGQFGIVLVGDEGSEKLNLKDKMETL